MTRPHCVLVSLLACACSDAPDVVVVQSAEPDPFQVDPRPTCKEGRYVGEIDGTLTFANEGVTLVGEIDFTLRALSTGEFSAAITRSSLSGFVGPDRWPFVASVVAEDGVSCTGDPYPAALANGQLTLADTDMPFTGMVEGRYESSETRFSGTWGVDFTDRDALAASGSWWASWVSE